jgi:hypothetical protein
VRGLDYSLFFSLSLIFFHVFSLFVSCFLYKKIVFYYNNTMDEHRHKILVVLVFTVAIAQVVLLQLVTITQHWSMMNALFCSKSLNMPPKVRSIWRYAKVIGYIWRAFQRRCYDNAQG